MERTFQSAVAGEYWTLVALSSGGLLACLWWHCTVFMFLLAAVVVFEIEMLVHTHYVVCGEGVLLVKSGRFVPDASIRISDIVSVRPVHAFRPAPALSADRLEIVYHDGPHLRTIHVSPRGKEGFTRCVIKLNPQIQTHP